MDEITLKRYDDENLESQSGECRMPVKMLRNALREQYGEFIEILMRTGESFFISREETESKIKKIEGK